MTDALTRGTVPLPITHECDKGGSLSSGPVGVDYDGYNYADPPGMAGGGGDRFVVTVGNRSGTVGFDCRPTGASVTGGDACSIASPRDDEGRERSGS